MPDDLSFFNRSMEYLIAVIQLYLCIQNSLGFYPHQRSHLAESMASALLNAKFSIPMRDLFTKLYFHIRIFINQLTHSSVNVTGTACQTACPCTCLLYTSRCV